MVTLVREGFDALLLARLRNDVIDYVISTSSLVDKIFLLLTKTFQIQFSKNRELKKCLKYSILNTEKKRLLKMGDYQDYEESMSVAGSVRSSVYTGVSGMSRHDPGKVMTHQESLYTLYR